MDQPEYQDIINSQRAFFASGATKTLAFRREQLRKLRRMVTENETVLFSALRQDLHKPPFEAYGGDIGSVLREIDHSLAHLRSWMRPKRVRTPIVYFPAVCSIVSEPYGVALIIGPWNFPVQLILCPLVGAIAAGNCAVLKPSLAAPATSHLLAKLIAEQFDPAFLTVIEGGAETAQALLEHRFDSIFYTGGTAVGRLVMQAAAKYLTPVTLELGGKNPCIVDQDIDIDVAARRIVWGKFFNAGQSCVAVDYLLVHRNVERELLSRIQRQITAFYGEDPSRSPDYGRIINDHHLARLERLLDGATIAAGGKIDRAQRYMAPTIVTGVSMNDPVMQDEIFGPILPVIVYDDIRTAVALVNSRPHPLALSVFSRNASLLERVVRGTRSGGVCINDTVIHQTIVQLPFGGVGPSGIGRYHGRESFETFSQKRSIVERGFLFDIRLRYPPYRDHLRLVKKIY